MDGWLAVHFGGGAAQALADLGDPAVVAVLVLLSRWPPGGALGAGCGAGPSRPVVAAALTEYVVKPLVDRHLNGYLAYPSGHITGFAAVALTVVVLAARPIGRPLPRRLAGTVAALAALLVVACGVGLVAQRYHYATDVVGGVCLSAAVVSVAALALDAVAGRRRH